MYPSSIRFLMKKLAEFDIYISSVSVLNFVGSVKRKSEQRRTINFVSIISNLHKRLFFLNLNSYICQNTIWSIWATYFIELSLLIMPRILHVITFYNIDSIVFRIMAILIVNLII